MDFERSTPAAASGVFRPKRATFGAMDDSHLIAAWRDGDRTAGRVLVERYYEAISRFFANKAGEYADDLIQRTFLICSESLGRFRGDGSVRAFIYGIARNVLYEHIRSRMKATARKPDFSVSSIVDLAPGVSTVAAQRAEQRVLTEAMQRIPLELQLLLELYYWEELRVSELAEVMGVPPGTIKSRLHRARALLQESIETVNSTR
jgi:RNA polymerase sigma factor (sigma-70 family)